ncbi:muts domain V-domain-containing protein [Melampsora americana]|nr:muts domain V-domain-containing protein [Melampsora americana]
MRFNPKTPFWIRTTNQALLTIVFLHSQSIISSSFIIHQFIMSESSNPIEDSQTSIQIIFAAVSWKNSIGCAYYDTLNGSLYLMEDAQSMSAQEEFLSMSMFLHIGTDALRSLQIFDQEAHANLHSNKTKEGLSLYGILNECVTYSGKMLLKNWLIRPSTQPEIISARADAVQCFLDSENEHCAGRMLQYLKSTGNLARTIMIVSSGKGRVGEWRSILNFMRSSLKICEESNSFIGFNFNIPLISRISDSEHNSELEDQVQKIDDVIDWQESKMNGGRVTVRNGIDDQLDELRESYAGLESKLDHLARKLSGETPFFSAPDFSIVYFPQIGYLCCIPRNFNQQEAEEPVHDGWEFQFATDTHLHYKNEYMRDLDHYIGDLTTSITEREIEIVNALEAALVDISPILLNLASDMAELDCLLSLAKIAHLREWVRPEVVEENLIEIEGGRHPLVEACVESFIENDTYMVGGKGLRTEDDSNDQRDLTPEEDINMNLEESQGSKKPHSMIVLTGANSSGKSVYIKQVAIIIILSQIGSYIPAQRAKVGIHDAIFTRVTSTESSSRNSSAFMIDLQQVSFMLRNCTRRSLLLLDEFGKGTDPIDGQAIFCSVVEHLIRRGTECPKTILSTHFHAIFSSGSMSVGLPINYCHMSIILSTNTHQSNSNRSIHPELEPTYLYKLSPGLVTSSHALGCAALFGAPMHVRLRAQGVSEALSKHEMLELMDTGMSEERIEELNRFEDVVRRFLRTDFGDLDGDEDRMDEDQNATMKLLREGILQVDDELMNE